MLSVAEDMGTLHRNNDLWSLNKSTVIYWWPVFNRLLISALPSAYLSVLSLSQFNQIFFIVQITSCYSANLTHILLFALSLHPSLTETDVAWRAWGFPVVDSN